MKRGKRDDNPNVRLSKKLSWLLRHGAQKVGLQLTSAGFATINDVLALQEFRNFTLQQIEQVVATNDKQRFTLQEIDGQLCIRANQGHTLTTLNDEDLLTLIRDASEIPVVVHGTYTKVISQIMKRGLYAMSRNHIHFAPGYPGDGQVMSGARQNCNAFIEIDVEAAMQNGIEFYRSQNNVILTRGFGKLLGPKFFRRVTVDHADTNFRFTETPFDYLLILDFEANCVEKGKMTCQEIIEFPCVALNTRSVQIDQIFHHYVRPTVVPEITQFCTNLTGITQEMVSGAALINEVLQEFDNFIQSLPSQNFVILTCGDWDLKTCLAAEAAYKSLQIPEYLKRWVNIKDICPTPGKHMMQMLNDFQIPHEGRHHSGIDDCRNLTNVVKNILRAGGAVYAEDVKSRKQDFQLKQFQKKMKISVTPEPLHHSLQRHVDSQEVFDEYDFDNSGSLDVGEIYKMFSKNRIGVRKQQLEELFQIMPTKAPKKLDFQEFCDFTNSDKVNKKYRKLVQPIVNQERNKSRDKRRYIPNSMQEMLKVLIYHKHQKELLDKISYTDASQDIDKFKKILELTPHRNDDVRQSLQDETKLKEKFLKKTQSTPNKVRRSNLQNSSMVNDKMLYYLKQRISDATRSGRSQARNMIEQITRSRSYRSGKRYIERRGAKKANLI